MSLQKTSFPALLMDEGAWIDAPPPDVVAAVVAALFLPPPPQPTRAKRARTRTATPADVILIRGTAGSFRYSVLPRYVFWTCSSRRSAAASPARATVPVSRT